jgi:hypothetical protein
MVPGVLANPHHSFFSDIKGDRCDQLDAAEDVAEMDQKVKLKTCESVFLDLLTFVLARPGPHSDPYLSHFGFLEKCVPRIEVCFPM